ALKRRCLFHWIGFPSEEREAEIIRMRAPTVSEELAASVASTIARIRKLDLVKLPGAAEAIDWANALALLGVDAVTSQAARESLGWVIKDRDDLERVDEALPELING
ncbi:MAG: AAA family ATPase, partial [bacterium]